MTKRTKSTNQASLDFEPELAVPETQPEPLPAPSITPPAAARLRPMREWQEVPQARFLSWSRNEQLAYCADRDEDSANNAESDEWAVFYLLRAASYAEMIQ